MWYEVAGVNGETVVSAEDEYDTMRKLAILSWAGSKEYTRIQLDDPKDFQTNQSLRGGQNQMICLCHSQSIDRYHSMYSLSGYLIYDHSIVYDRSRV